MCWRTFLRHPSRKNSHNPFNWKHPDTRETFCCFWYINTINDGQLNKCSGNILRRQDVPFRWTPMNISCIEAIFYSATTKKTKAKIEPGKVFSKKKPSVRAHLRGLTLTPTSTKYLRKLRTNLPSYINSTLNWNFHVQFQLLHLYTDTYCIGINLVNGMRLDETVTKKMNNNRAFPFKRC